jgi:ubiquinone/menaquinone biosynthesis C-methylase UbiE
MPNKKRTPGRFKSKKRPRLNASSPDRKSTQTFFAQKRFEALIDLRNQAVSQLVVDRLDSIEVYRKIYTPACRSLILHLLNSLEAMDIEAQETNIIEIGTGTGQLRAWLPDTICNKVVHTEPLLPVIKEFQKRWPDANIYQASAENLPFENAQVSLALGLCVLDVINDGKQVVKELARVLRPGGYFVHILDMGVGLEPIFIALHDLSMVPIPNVFSEIYDTVWPKDMFLMPYDELKLVVKILLKFQHPLADPLSNYLNSFSDLTKRQDAIANYTHFATIPEYRQAFVYLFCDAYNLADNEQKQALQSFTGQPYSSAMLFAEVLNQWFSPKSGFEIIYSDIVSNALSVKRGTILPYRYESLCVGNLRNLPKIPINTLTGKTEADLEEDQTLLEVGIFIFVARRTNEKNSIQK